MRSHILELRSEHGQLCARTNSSMRSHNKSSRINYCAIAHPEAEVAHAAKERYALAQSQVCDRTRNPVAQKYVRSHPTDHQKSCAIAQLQICDRIKQQML
ncbi:unnamed protein product [Rhodiola kirilowii]